MIEPVPRRLPAPWSVREVTGGYVVLDASGRRVAFIYGEPGSRGANSDTLTPEEARRVAVNIAKLPSLLKAPFPKREGT